MKQWDAFISHASEDKNVVDPLAEALRGAGLKIWLDHQALHLGDSLREKIDEGLAESRFGIVILSPSFLAKSWPKRELNGLMALEELGHKVILPVWHQMTKETLLSHSPILADRLASDTAHGITSVAADITQVILDRGSGSPALEAPTLARRLIELLDGAPEKSAIHAFLAAHPKILQQAAGAALHSCSVQMNQIVLDLCLLQREGTTNSHRWFIVQLESPRLHPFPNGTEPTANITARVAELEALRRWVPGNIQIVRRSLAEFNASFQGVVVAGRRALLTSPQREVLGRYNDERFGVTLRTYDWLVEAAVQVS
jgi:hypothetical protein